MICLTPTTVRPNNFGAMDKSVMLSLAAKYVWWNSPEYVVATLLDRLTVNVMEMGSWEDANQLLAEIGPERFISVLRSPPAGLISTKSLRFWHYRLGLPGEPPKARQRTFQQRSES